MTQAVSWFPYLSQHLGSPAIQKLIKLKLTRLSPWPSSFVLEQLLNWKSLAIIVRPIRHVYSSVTTIFICYYLVAW
jgi:hypothetical protein